MKKNPFEFWSYRDIRKEKFPSLKIVKIPNDSSDIQKKIQIQLSHHYLIPREQVSKVILEHFKTSLTIINPEFNNWVKYGKGFVPKYIKPYIEMYVADSKYLGLPRSIKFEEVKNVFQKQNIEVELIDKRPEFEQIQLNQNLNFKPYYYQKEAIQKIIDENIILKFFCGRGKTTLTLLAISEIQLRTLILVKTGILIKQWLEEIHNVFDIEDKDIGIINGDSKTEGKITIATIQSINNFSRERKRKIAETYGHVVIDEVHESAAPQSYKLLQYFKCKKITGLSATPYRSDGRSKILSCYIGPIKKVDDSGVIPIKFDLVKTNFDFKLRGRKNEYNSMMESLIADEERNSLILDKIEEYHEKKKGVLFIYSNRIIHLETLQRLLKERRPDIKSGLVVGKTSDGKRMKLDEQNHIRQLANKEEIRIIFGTQIIKQGFNVKPLSVGITATPAKSPILIEQILGRKQREYKEKDEVIYVDFIDEKVKILLYQFFYKNKKIFKPFRKLSDDSREAMEIKRTKIS